MPQMETKIVYRATVEGVSTVDVHLRVLPADDGETPFVIGGDERLQVNVPSGSDDSSIQRAFGALFGIEGAVRITVETDPQ